MEVNETKAGCTFRDSALGAVTEPGAFAAAMVERSAIEGDIEGTDEFRVTARIPRKSLQLRSRRRCPRGSHRAGNRLALSILVLPPVASFGASAEGHSSG